MTEPQRSDQRKGLSLLEELVREARRNRAAVGGYIGTAVGVTALLVALSTPWQMLAGAVVLIFVLIPLLLIVVHDEEASPRPSPARDLALATLKTSSRLATRRTAVMSGAVVLLVALVVWLRPGDRGDADDLPFEGVDAALLDPDAVAILPFTVTDPQDASLGDGMVALLAIEMTQQRGARPVNTWAVFAAWRSWQERGVALTPAEARGIAEGLGAGRVVLGSVVAMPGVQPRTVLRAELIDVANGSTLAQSATDALSRDSLSWSVLQLTAALFGHDVPNAAPRSPTALRSYMEGESFYRAGQYDSARIALGKSLEEDPDFALAGLRLASAASWLSPFPRSEAESGIMAAVRGRDGLPRGSARFLDAVAGPRYPGPSTLAEYLDAWELAVQAAPRGPEALFEFGDAQLHWGAMTGSQSWRSDAKEAIAQSLNLDTAYAAPKGHLLEIAILEGDTARVRQLRAHFPREAEGDSDAHIHWLAAAWLGDTDEQERLRDGLTRMSRADLRRIVGIGQLHGLGLDDAELAAAEWRRQVESADSRRRSLNASLHALALNRGRPLEALELTAGLTGGDPVPDDYLRVRILDALYWDGDSAAATESVERIERSIAAPRTPGGEQRHAYFASSCALELWRLEHRDARTAARSVALLRSVSLEVDGPRVMAESAACADMLETMLAVHENHATADSLLARLDSLMREGPAGLRSGPSRILTRSPGVLQTTLGLAGGGLEDFGNLVVARMYERRCNLDAALQAVRRRPYYWNATLYLSTYLLEEGRLAAATGDREGARRAYRHYLALRSGPGSALSDSLADAARRLSEIESGVSNIETSTDCT